MQEQLILQVQSVFLSTVIIVAVLGMANPYLNVSFNKWTVVSEAVIIVTLELLLFSSDPSVPVDHRQNMGFGIITIVGLNIAIT